MSSYRVLALKWRPQRFGDVAGQAHISKTLSNALQTGRAAHAYLFTGPRGVGKTSMARVLAKAFNCKEGSDAEPCGRCSACREITEGSALDVIEIDGASNRGIDDIRELREGVRYAPARLQRKVYIIDEVHMLTSEAFNALLKTLEEPPDHVVFVLATTEVLKVPQTILSRCQRFDFARLRSVEAVARLTQICESEGIAVENDALQLIAVKGEGSMRDALTLLDQVAATGERPITSKVVRDALGIVGRELYFSWTTAIREGRTADLLASLGRAVDEGANLVELGEEFLLHLRNLLLVATDPGLSTQIECTEEERTAYRADAEGFETADLLRFCRMLMEALTQMRRSSFPRVHLEVALAEMSALPRAIDLRRFVDAVRQRVPEDPVLPPIGASGESLPKGGSASPADSGRRVRVAQPAPELRAREAPITPELRASEAQPKPAPRAREGPPTPALPARDVRPKSEASERDASTPALNAALVGEVITTDVLDVDARDAPDKPLADGSPTVQATSSAILESFEELWTEPESRGDSMALESWEDESIPLELSPASVAVLESQREESAELGSPSASIVVLESRGEPTPSKPEPPDVDPWVNAMTEIAAAKPSLQGFLYGARAGIDSDDVLLISIPAKAGIYLELLQARDNRRIVTLAVQHAYGRPLGVRFEANAVAAPAVVPRSSEKENSGSGGAIQRIVELFDGDVLGSA